MALHLHDIFVHICKEFPINKMVKLELISNVHNICIKNYEWHHTQILAENDDEMNHYTNVYKLRNLYPAYDCNNYIEELQKCHTVKLDFLSINNKSIKKFKECYEISFGYYVHKIKSSTLMKLHYCHTIILFDSNFDMNGLKYLKNCHDICLTFCRIKDKHVKHLRKCHTLGLEGALITNKSVKYLQNCHTLYFSTRVKIDEKHKKYLTKKCKNVSFDFNCL